MRAFGFRQHSAPRRRKVSAGEFFAFKSEWMESGQQGVVTPTVFLIEQPPHSLLRTHFHRQNQYQLFVQGSGSIGPHPLAPYTLHYAGAYTGYGPIQAGPEGLSYFTIRATYDVGAGFVPEALPQMLRGPKRQAHTAPFGAALQTPGSQALFGEPGEDLHAERRTLRPGESIDLRGQAAGTFALVLAGQLAADGQPLGLWEHVYLAADEPPLQATAGVDGCSLVICRVPALVEQYQPAG